MIPTKSKPEVTLPKRFYFSADVFAQEKEHIFCREYTLPPDRDFIVGAVPGRRNAFMAVGAGHAFKFASALGRILSELAGQGATPADISGFSFERPILQQADPPKSYMV